MSNLSIPDLNGQRQRERIAAVLAMSLTLALDQLAKIFAISPDTNLVLLSGIRLSVPDAGRRR
jgi:hypothetical protein